MLTIKDFSKTYEKSDKKAVDGLNLELKKGEIFGFLGSNGAGKTTTIKAVTGIIANFEGTIEVDGHDVKKDPIAAKAIMGYVPDNHTAFERLSGIEYLNFMGDIYGVESSLRKEKIEELANDFSMTDALKKPINSYSHGMKQKIVVMGVLLHDPQLWILDEPMTGLDPQSAFELKEKMKEHKAQGKTVFFSSHVLEVVEKICDRVAIIDKGKLIAVGTIDELKGSSGDLESYFLKLTAKE